MIDKGKWETPFWYVVHTKPNQENRAESNMKALGLETLNPRICELRFNPYTGKPTKLKKPLFPTYIFAKLMLRDHYHKLRFTRGIKNLVSFGGDPCPVDHLIISLIASRIGQDGLIVIDDVLLPGDQVVICDGPFKNFTGVFERDKREDDRIRILLDTVGYQAHVEIERAKVGKANAVAPSLLASSI